jgi:hypothetical protein
MKLSLLKGTGSKLVHVFLQNSSSTTGAGLTGVVFNSASFSAYYIREGAGAAVAITLATMTLGTWATGGFVAVDGTNMPGLYQLGLPNAALAAGANSVVVMLKGVLNLAPVLLEIELTGTDNQDAVRYGLSALPTTPMMFKRNQALSGFEFLMVQSSDHVTAKTGLTITATRSIDGAAFAACTNAATEVSSGIYTINLSAADLNGGVITFLFTGTAADNRYVTIVTQS